MPVIQLRYNDHIPYNAHYVYNGSVRLPDCDPSGRIIEFDRYVAADGHVYDLHAPYVHAVISDTGTGMPPIHYITERGPNQDGETLENFFLQPRTVQMVIRDNAVSRTALYDLRRDLINAVRPNRDNPPLPGTLKRYMPNSDVLCLDCVLHSGLTFPARNPSVWDERSLSDTIQFYAPDPTYYLEQARTQQFTGLIDQLVFPCVFPILFGALDTTINVMYYGGWDTYPTLAVTGPIQGMTVTNKGNGLSFSLLYLVPAGMSVAIDLRYGFKTATLSDGTDLTPYLVGDVGTWHLAPAPEVLGGYNTIEVSGSHATAATNIIMTWHDRYIGMGLLPHL
jgi:hypothetical protein